MAIKKIGSNRWRVTTSVRSKSKAYPVTKKRIVEGTRSEAVAVEAEMLRELRARSLTIEYARTFGDALDLHLEHLRRVGKCCVEHERRYARLRRDLGHVLLENFADQFEVYLRRYACSVTRYGRYPSNGSINRYVAIARAVFKRMVDIDLLDKNPLTKVRFPNLAESPRNRYLTQEERLRMVNAIRCHRPYILPIVQYMMSVPCRVSELTKARREQYSPITNTIFIPDSKAGIPIHKPVPEGMVDYFRSIPEGCPWLFYYMDKYGTYHSLVHRLRSAWEYCCQVAGVTNLRRHDLRHMAATDMILAGNSERVVMKAAGWKSNMLSTYYNSDSLFSAKQAVFDPIDYPGAVG